VESFFHNTTKPPNQPNGVSWLAELHTHGERRKCRHVPLVITASRYRFLYPVTA
jgi:hypothetical protein